MKTNPPKCPHHNEDMILMYGWVFDYDRYICGVAGCDYEIGLDASTYPDEEEGGR